MDSLPHLQNLFKTRLAVCNVSTLKENEKHNFLNKSRRNRDLVLNTKRHIDVESLVNTPEPQCLPKKQTLRERKKLEYEAWKKQKLLKKENESKGKRPIFKVSATLGFPTVQRALSEIKGKKIPAYSNKERHDDVKSLAPPDYKFNFCALSSVMPQVETNKNAASDCTRVTRSRANANKLLRSGKIGRNPNDSFRSTKVPEVATNVKKRLASALKTVHPKKEDKKSKVDTKRTLKVTEKSGNASATGTIPKDRKIILKNTASLSRKKDIVKNDKPKLPINNVEPHLSCSQSKIEDFIITTPGKVLRICISPLDVNKKPSRRSTKQSESIVPLSAKKNVNVKRVRTPIPTSSKRISENTPVLPIRERKTLRTSTKKSIPIVLPIEDKKPIRKSAKKLETFLALPVEEKETIKQRKSSRMSKRQSEKPLVLLSDEKDTIKAKRSTRNNKKRLEEPPIVSPTEEKECIKPMRKSLRNSMKNVEKLLVSPTDDSGTKTPRKSVKQSDIVIVSPIEDCTTDEDVRTPKMSEWNSTVLHVTPSSSNTQNLIYVSPFVTKSRGKDKARKEFHDRRSAALSIQVGSPMSENDRAAGMYFRNLLDTEISRLQNRCSDWECYKNENELVEGALEMIDTAIGQTNLLINKKFKQFRSLIDSFEKRTSEKPILCEDLHGFWDMIYMQVVNLGKRFQTLVVMRDNNWEEIQPIVKHFKKKKNGKKETKKKGVPSTGIRAAIAAARKKLKDENGPLVKGANSPMPKTPVDNRKSHRKSLKGTLKTETPGRSILKSINRINTSPRKSKSVLFNNIASRKSLSFSDDLIVFSSPEVLTSRRSSRLSLKKS